jgi:hypothetical protein
MYVALIAKLQQTSLSARHHIHRQVRRLHSPSGIVPACGFSSLVGVFFAYSARRASKLLQADCLL